ncbi:UPF0481 protein At3g47200-like [Nymphaea colorata]|nr:UPF0481 protein At3g47200-like [Nymphaea colorata]
MMELQEENTTIQIQEDAAPISDWVADITNDYDDYVSLGTRGGGQSVKCIFKWPHDLVQLLGKGIDHEPKLVAIGPYHHGRRDLQPMEDHKKKALFRVLSLSPGVKVSSFVEALKQREQELRDQYDELDTRNWPSDSFIKMMLLDGCFLLDMLFPLDAFVEPPLDQSINNQLFDTYRENVLVRDVFYLLENQIPGLVLDVLVKVGNCKYFPDPSKGPLLHEALHLLDYVRRRFMLDPKAFIDGESCDSPSNVPERQASVSGQPVDRPSTGIIAILPKKKKFVRSARKLEAAGVIFKKLKDSNNVFHLSFSGGVLSLPEFELNETSEGLLMNMVAFERMHPESDGGVTSFMSFMDAIIDTAEDVSILGKAGIVTNNLGSDEAAAKIFNKLGVVEMFSPFDKVLEEVVTYASAPHHGWRAHFEDKYLANPWTILSLTGALCLLFLTALQTVYTVFSYYPH